MHIHVTYKLTHSVMVMRMKCSLWRLHKVPFSPSESVISFFSCETVIPVWGSVKADVKTYMTHSNFTVIGGWNQLTCCTLEENDVFLLQRLLSPVAIGGGKKMSFHLLWNYLPLWEHLSSDVSWPGLIMNTAKSFSIPWIPYLGSYPPCNLNRTSFNSLACISVLLRPMLSRFTHG